MAVQLLEIGIKMRKGVIFITRGCFRSVCNHPFLVGVLSILIYVYRSSPFIFSLLVSASPILICTAVLLGALLSFGQPNLPEIEIEQKTTDEAALMKIGVSRDAIVVEQNEGYYVERYSEERRDGADQSAEELSLSASNLAEICREDSSRGTTSLIEERSPGSEVENGEIWEANSELGDVRDKRKSDWNEERLSDGEVMENHYASLPKVNDEDLESDDEKSRAGSFDSERVNVDSLDSPPRSTWKQIQEQDDEEEGDDDALDSGSDGGESSSPDASMADIMPMLDELHPLLDEDAPQPVQMIHDGSDVASEQSSQFSSSSHELDDETEDQDDLEVVDDDQDDGEDGQGDKEEQTKSAITWTEEDEKNLMDVGSSEIERNQRLENLLLRRRARKNMSMVPEINLIDLESYDCPFHIAPISTTRHNPFDLPNDSYDNSGLPPIPGSAPSILLPRRNPFDIPYDSREDKPNPMGDGFQEELSALLSREPFFRRHESFSVGPSIFAPNRQDKLRPYFVPERMVSEESSYFFQRQSSDSKLSSVPETESVSSVENLEDQKLAEEDNCHEPDVISRMEEVAEECPSGDQEPFFNREVSEEDVPREPELISEMKHVSEHVGHGSQSSEEENALELGQSQDVEDHFGEGSVARQDNVQATGYHDVEQGYSRGSSSSSLSEVSDRVFTETAGERLSMLGGKTDGLAEEPAISTQTSVACTDMSTTSTLADDASHKEPVYDSSPPAVPKNLSSSSGFSDVHAESDLGMPPVLIKRTVFFTERESEGINQEIEKGIPGDIETLPESLLLHQADEHESAQVDINVKDHGNKDSDFSQGEQSLESQGASAVSVPSKSSVEASAEENLMEQHTQNEVPGTSSDFNTHALVKSSDDKNLGPSEEGKNLLVSVRESLTQIKAPPFGGPLEGNHSIDEEQTVLSPDSDADVYHEAKEKLISTPSAGGSTPLFYDIAMHDPKFEHLTEVQVPNTPVESFEKVQSIQNLDIPEFHELDHDSSPNIKSPLSPDFISMPSTVAEEASSYVDAKTIIEEADDIKEIDEGLLSELDSVGDFSTTQWGSGSDQSEKHIDSVGESLSLAHPADTSTMKVVEVNCVEVNKTEHPIHLENLKDGIDIHEEDMECISEPQISQTSITQHINIPKSEFNEREGQNSTDRITSEEETLSKENEAKNLEVDMQSLDSCPKKAKLTSMETEVIEGSTEVSHHRQVDTDTSSGIPEIEAQKLEHTEKPAVLESPKAKLVIGETIDKHSENVNASAMDSTHEKPIVEVRSVEDPTLVGSRETQGTLELHAVETIPSEATSLPPKEVLDSKRERELPQSTDDGPTEVEAEKLGSSVGKEPSEKQISSVAAEKPCHEVKAFEDSHLTKPVKGKGKISKSSSSSSSSESSSSNSD